MNFTKEQLRNAMFLLLDDVLPYMECESIKKRGNYLCDRCDECMFNQYIKKAKDGETPKIDKQKLGSDTK
jgi:hypothetical protein